jgi:hypothetical protein
VSETETTLSAAHLIYIPLCVLVGVVIGWFLGGRSARSEVNRLQRLLEAEEERQAAERVAATRSDER